MAPPISDLHFQYQPVHTKHQSRKLKHPRLPHVGGTLPPLLDRFIAFSTIVPGGRVLSFPTVKSQLATRFYFDLAGIAFDGPEGGEGQVKALTQGWGVGGDSLMYGCV